MDHVSTRITKRMVQQATPSSRRYIIWDRELKGFGIRIESTGTKCYLVRYRPKGIAGAPKRFITIGRHGPVTAEQARTRALSILGSVASGHDPAGSERAGKDTLILAEAVRLFMQEHVRLKRKPRTAEYYQQLFTAYVTPSFGRQKVDSVT